MRAVGTIFVNAVPIVLMIGLIPFVENDVALSIIDIAIIVVALFIHYEKRDAVLLIFGLVGLLISEYFFIATGVETFARRSLLGVMPLWLPFLWGYVFVAIRRGIAALT